MPNFMRASTSRSRSLRSPDSRAAARTSRAPARRRPSHRRVELDDDVPADVRRPARREAERVQRVRRPLALRIENAAARHDVDGNAIATHSGSSFGAWEGGFGKVAERRRSRRRAGDARPTGGVDDLDSRRRIGILCRGSSSVLSRRIERIARWARHAPSRPKKIVRSEAERHVRRRESERRTQRLEEESATMAASSEHRADDPAEVLACSTRRQGGVGHVADHQEAEHHHQAGSIVCHGQVASDVAGTAASA